MIVTGAAITSRGGRPVGAVIRRGVAIRPKPWRLVRFHVTLVTVAVLGVGTRAAAPVSLESGVWTIRASLWED